MTVKKILVAVMVLATMAAGASAPKKEKAPKGDWLQKALDKKEKVVDAGVKGLPLVTDVFRRGTEPGIIDVDVTGMNQLVLVSWGTLDGRDWDWSVWANAKLTRKDGSTVWLDDVQDFKTTGGEALRNKNFNGKPFQIRDSHYTRGIMMHAENAMIIPLNGEYTRFQSEVGIDEGSSGGSVIFKVLPTDGKKEAEELLAAAPEISSKLTPFIGVPLEDWLTTPGTILERAAAEKVVNMLANKDYFNGELSRWDAEKSDAKKIRGYMEIANDAAAVLRSQSQLKWLNIEAVQRAFNDMKNMPGYDVVSNQAKLDELLALGVQGFDGIYKMDKASNDAIKRALELKRDILLANPLLDIDKIVVTRYKLGETARHASAPSMGTPPNNWSNQFSSTRKTKDAEILELSNLRGGQLNERQIYAPGISGQPVTDVHLHWDADRMLFTTLDNTQRWQVYQIKVDGTGFEQITTLPDKDIEFSDACYLPDGRVIVNSNLGYTGVPCVSGSDAVGALCLLNPEDGKMRRLTFDQDNNWNPTVMNNGRIMYTRWEYTDLMHYYARFVMHMNPDGTENKCLYGSGGYFPNSTFDMQPLPGNTNAFIGVISGHHGVERSGRLLIFDPAKGRKEEIGVVQEIPYSNRPVIPIIKDELVNGVWPQFIKPNPINDKYFLVSAKLEPNGLWGIYLVDVYDNMTLIAEGEGEGYINPIPLMARKTPPVVPDRINEKDREATVFIQDIYEGEGLKGVPRGTVKKLRVMSYEFAYYQSPSDHFAQGVQSGWDIKRLLGEVDVEPDGSAIFKVPACMPISLQPLDSMGRTIQWMRSWLTGQPGETVSCIGCHEDQNQIAMPKRVMASLKKPSAITPPEGGVRSFTFELEVQPILTRACVACHDGSNNLPNFASRGVDPKTGFGLSYLEFNPYFYRQGSEAELAVLNPYEYHETASEMMQILRYGHHNVTLTEKEWRTLYNWVDFNLPYRGTFVTEKRSMVPNHEPVDQYVRRRELTEKYAGTNIDWRKEIADYAEYLASQPEIVPEMPVAVKKESKDLKVSGWPFTADQARQMVAQAGGSERKNIEITPGITMNFVRIPAGQYVMGNDKAMSSEKQIVKIDKPFWMSEMEVSNEQMRVFVPEHDSRFVGQFWKDHTHQGYPANNPEKSAIRMSYEKALEFCARMSKETGLKVNLPTEQQWEWAARAGSEDDFWFGTTNSDFTPFENLADYELTKMAVSGVDPHPMNHNDFWYPYLNYIPKDESVNDGNMLMTQGGSYLPNPWGLYDMHGNVAEWTRSDNYPDPANTNTAEKVVRGGSWYDRTKNATASSRRSFLPWQQVWYVGFRVILED